ncbi:MAG TPA: 30S ribosomal protein S12 methylthiotransferase RimO, partial [Flavobacteriaceae bacterium]|nr:30S ribosomal protein S12 methylthiotransferase RimO [Flavobacteriaceae bacterium]
EIMEIQGQISWELNQEKIGKVLRVMIDRKEGAYFIGRTEFDSPSVDNEVLIEAAETYLRPGDFYRVEITAAEDFDLYGRLIEKPDDNH